MRACIALHTRSLLFQSLNIQTSLQHHIKTSNGSIAMSLDPYDLLHIRINPDGTVTRFLQPPSEDPNPEAGPGDVVVTKDITLNAETKTWVRIHRPTKLPSNDNEVARLPIIIFFRGGGWVMFSAASTLIHMIINQVCITVPAIVVSVDYRLAPENRLPAQYDDAMEAIMWVKKQFSEADGEPWLRDYGDISRCYLQGNGNGGNIAFHAAVRSVDADLGPMKIRGLILNSPMFGGKQRTRSELKHAADQLTPLPALDLSWELVLPKGTDRDHRFCNPMIDGPHKNKIGQLGRCLVMGFGQDPTIDKQQQFVTMLVTQGVQVEAKFDEVGFHGIEVVDPRRLAAVLNYIKEFVI